MSDCFLIVLILQSSKITLFWWPNFSFLLISVDDQTSVQHSQDLQKFVELLMLQPVNHCVLLFLSVSVSFWGIPIFVILWKHICTSSIQSQHFSIFFAFYQGVDSFGYLQDILKHWNCFSIAWCDSNSFRQKIPTTCLLSFTGLHVTQKETFSCGK